MQESLFRILLHSNSGATWLRKIAAQALVLVPTASNSTGLDRLLSLRVLAPDRETWEQEFDQIFEVWLQKIPLVRLSFLSLEQQREVSALCFEAMRNAKNLLRNDLWHDNKIKSEGLALRAEDFEDAFHWVLFRKLKLTSAMQLLGLRFDEAVVLRRVQKERMILLGKPEFERPASANDFVARIVSQIPTSYDRISKKDPHGQVRTLLAKYLAATGRSIADVCTEDATDWLDYDDDDDAMSLSAVVERYFGEDEDIPTTTEVVQAWKKRCMPALKAHDRNAHSALMRKSKPRQVQTADTNHALERAYGFLKNCIIRAIREARQNATTNPNGKV